MEFFSDSSAGISAGRTIGGAFYEIRWQLDSKLNKGIINLYT